MAIRNLRYEGDEILSKKSKPVDEITDKTRELIKDMIDTMHKFDGVGLAAVQVGILKQIVVIDLYEEEKPVYVLINPEIIYTKGKHVVDEGCLSFPNKFAKVERPEEVKVKALNEKGETVEIVGTGLLAQAIVHEIDHLNGEVFVDKIVPGTLEYVKPEENKK